MIISEPKKIYVRPDNTIVLTCPHCGQQREVLVSFFKDKRKLRVRCCYTFRIIVEFRKRIRKKIQLNGTYINHSQEDREDNLTIQDLSVSGLSFICFNSQLFKVEDELTLEFILDDEYQTVIRKRPLSGIFAKVQSDANLQVAMN